MRPFNVFKEMTDRDGDGNTWVLWLHRTTASLFSPFTHLTPPFEKLSIEYCKLKGKQSNMGDFKYTHGWIVGSRKGQSLTQCYKDASKNPVSTKVKSTTKKKIFLHESAKFLRLD